MDVQLTIDGRPLVGNRTGIGVHTAEIAGRLSIDPPPLIASHAPIDDQTSIERCRFRVDHAPNGILWQQFILPRIARAGVLWGPHGTIPVALRIPSVITLHDFTSITMPGRHLLKTIVSYNLFIGRSLEKAARIAAVSQRIAEEAMRSFGVAASKIEIVPNGVDEFFSPGQDGDSDRLRDPYILYVGTLEPRKGIDDLLFAWGALREPKPRLVLCGDRGWANVKSACAEIEVTGFVNRERLRELYRGATVFVYPSHYEGFGIPPLEAMACGAPVVATRTGAIPEYAADASVLVDPADRDGLRDSLARLLGDRALRDELRKRGPQRAKLYRWDRSAKLMEQLITEAARCS